MLELSCAIPVSLSQINRIKVIFGEMNMLPVKHKHTCYILSLILQFEIAMIKFI